MTRTLKPQHIAIYTRISKDDEQSMAGVERQEEMCRELIADRYGSDVTIDVYCDNNRSAWSGARRPHYERLMADMQAGRVDLVVCYATDRLYRLVRLLEDIITASEVNGSYVPIVGVRSNDVDLATADGRMIARQLATMAQHSSDKTSERLKDMNADHAAKGWAPPGPAPYGYERKANPGGARCGHTYVQVPAEAQVVRDVVASLEQGDSMVAIARALNYRGIPKRSGGEWKPDDIRRMVISPAIAGLRGHTPRKKGKKGKVWRQSVTGKGNWKAIIPRPRWEAIEEILGDEKRRQRSPGQNYWLSGVLITEDGRSLVGSVTRGSNGVDRRIYRANRSGDLPFVSIDADEVEGAVERFMLALGTDYVGTATEAPTDDELASIDELDEVDEMLADVGRRSVLSPDDDDYLLPAEAQGMRRGLRERRAKAEAMVPTVVAPSALRPGESATDAWPDLTADGRRETTLGLLGHITVQAVGRAKVPVAGRLDFEKPLPVPA